MEEYTPDQDSEIERQRRLTQTALDIQGLYADNNPKRAGDLLNEFLKETYPLLRDKAFHLTHGDYWAAEDTVQLTQLRASKALMQQRFEGASQVTTWLHSILARQVASYYAPISKRQSREVPLEDVTINELLDTKRDMSDQVVSKLIAQDQLQQIYRRLSKEEGQILFWSKVLGIGAVVIGGTLGIKAGTAKVRVHRAKEKAKDIGLSLDND